MLNKTTTWRDVVAKAENYKALGQMHHSLHSNLAIDLYPWQLVSEIKSAGIHRIGMSTHVKFIATHESGLSFDWTIDLEFNTAAGSHCYQFDVVLLSGIAQRLPQQMRAVWGEYLKTMAETLKLSVDKLKRSLKEETHQLDVMKNIADDCARDATI